MTWNCYITSGSLGSVAFCASLAENITAHHWLTGPHEGRPLTSLLVYYLNKSLGLISHLNSKLLYSYLNKKNWLAVILPCKST